MKIQKGNLNISYIGQNFKDWFEETEVSPEKISPEFKTLERNMNDKEILSELKPEEITLNELAYILEKNLLEKEGFCICYIRDSALVLRAVRVFWDGDGWHVNAVSVEDPYEWFAGHQVFSRNSAEKETLENKIDALQKAVLDSKERIDKLENGYTDQELNDMCPCPVCEEYSDWEKEVSRILGTKYLLTSPYDEIKPKQAKQDIEWELGKIKQIFQSQKEKLIKEIEGEVNNLIEDVDVFFSEDTGKTPYQNMFIEAGNNAIEKVLSILNKHK